ncbi:MAG: radical SAM protein [Burkholderiales bacterium]|nr:radical SAM protein [Burkholderiales bacterium]
MQIERLSIELTNRCDKGCGFCYNHSQPEGDTLWTVPELLTLIEDCRQYDVRAVSFGGGEPLQYAGVFELLLALEGKIFRSLTSNGLLLCQDTYFEQLVAARPDKVHLSIHKPASQSEVTRVIETALKLQNAGITSGVNLLVAADQLAAASHAVEQLHQHGIDNRRIVYLPQRGGNTPTPKEVAKVAKEPFQAMSCLNACGKSPRFCAISWDKSVAWCSYTASRRPLPALNYAGVLAALQGLDIIPCATTTRPQTISWQKTSDARQTTPLDHQA